MRHVPCSKHLSFLPTLFNRHVKTMRVDGVLQSKSSLAV
jgi:hypothetical protein